MLDQTQVQSPFLPSTQIQFAWLCRKADWMIENGIREGECLISHLAPNAKGYSNVSFGRAHRMRAHRVVYIAKYGYIPDEIMVLHTCDVRNCIEPKHLFKGSAQDNTDDMIAKGRKIDDPTVGLRRRQETASRIRPYYDQGLSNHEIASKLYLSYNTVRTYTFAFSAGYEYPVRA